MSVNGQFLSIAGGVEQHITATIPTGTTSYGTAVNMGTYDSVIIYVKVPTAQASTTTQLYFQWSNDGLVASSSWWYEQVDNTATATATTQPYTPLIRVINIPMGTAGNVYIARFHRMGAFFRCAMDTQNVTTGTITITTQKASNFN